MTNLKVLIETHPFIPFVPKRAKYLLLGSFPGRRETWAFEWYYGTQKGQFWKVMQEVYKRPLVSLAQKKALMEELNIALSDVIYRLTRREGNNSDGNLEVLEYNTKTIPKILEENKIERIYFSSRNVERIFKSQFKNLNLNSNVELITLPSSSPRYAKLNLGEKVLLFKKLLPKL